MPTFSPQQLQSFSGGTWLNGHVPAGAVAGFTQDTRQLKAGMCFVALQTAQRDGHAFLPAALEAGAAMALVSRAQENCPLPQLVVADALAAFQAIARAHRLLFNGTVIGVTGSCGKTSAKNMLRHLLAPEGCHATEGNLNNFIGVPLTLLALETGSAGACATGSEGVTAGAIAGAGAGCVVVGNEPESGDARAGAVGGSAGDCADAAGGDVPRFAVVEAGISEPAEMAVLADMIRPDVVLITMVGPAHLEELGSIEGVAREKASLAAAQSRPPAFTDTTCTPKAGAESVVPVADRTAATAGVGLRGKANNAVALPPLLAPLACWQYPAFAALDNPALVVAPAASMEALHLQLEAILPPSVLAGVDASAPSQCKASAGRVDSQGVSPARIRAHRFNVCVAGAGDGAASCVLELEGPLLSGRFPLGFAPSEGMASNVALALLAARVCGVAQEQLAARMAGWQPSGNRGQWLERGNKRFFVDCYNANPASMCDALSLFASGQTGGARLFVLGGMRELGTQSAAWHRKVGEHLGRLLGDDANTDFTSASSTAQPRPQPHGAEASRRDAAAVSAAAASATDTVILIGAEADNAALEQGLRAYAPAAVVHSFGQTQQAQHLVDAFAGVVFLKGSRFYALESLLPKEPPA